MVIGVFVVRHTIIASSSVGRNPASKRLVPKRNVAIVVICLQNAVLIVPAVREPHEIAYAGIARRIGILRHST